MHKVIGLASKKKVSVRRQKVMRAKSAQLVGNIVVVRTLFGYYVGCLLNVDPVFGTITLRVFSGFDRVFVNIVLGFPIIFDIFDFPCGLLLGKKARAAKKK